MLAITTSAASRQRQVANSFFNVVQLRTVLGVTPSVVDDTREGDAGDDQVGTKMKEDRRRKHEAKQVAAGFTRCIVRCHVDDVAKIKAYAATLLRERRRTS